MLVCRLLIALCVLLGSATEGGAAWLENSAAATLPSVAVADAADQWAVAEEEQYDDLFVDLPYLDDSRRDGAGRHLDGGSP